MIRLIVNMNSTSGRLRKITKSCHVGYLNYKCTKSNHTEINSSSIENNSSATINSLRQALAILLTKTQAMRILPILTLLLIPILCIAQEPIISGIVLLKSKKPIANANVFIEGSYDGANTDSLGRFSFKTRLSGVQQINVTAIGFQSKQLRIQIQHSLFLKVILQADERAIEEVVVRAGQFKVGSQANAVLTPLDIVTTAGSMGNIIAA